MTSKVNIRLQTMYQWNSITGRHQEQAD